MAKQKQIILGVTGSIAVYKACEILRQLIKAGYSVSVVMTKEAEEFIRPALFQGLSGTRYIAAYLRRPRPGRWNISLWQRRQG